MFKFSLIENIRKRRINSAWAVFSDIMKPFGFSVSKNQLSFLGDSEITVIPYKLDTHFNDIKCVLIINELNTKKVFSREYSINTRRTSELYNKPHLGKKNEIIKYINSYHEHYTEHDDVIVKMVKDHDQSCEYYTNLFYDFLKFYGYKLKCNEFHIGYLANLLRRGSDHKLSNYYKRMDVDFDVMSLCLMVSKDKYMRIYNWIISGVKEMEINGQKKVLNPRLDFMKTYPLLTHILTTDSDLYTRHPFIDAISDKINNAKSVVKEIGEFVALYTGGRKPSSKDFKFTNNLFTDALNGRNISEFSFFVFLSFIPDSIRNSIQKRKCFLHKSDIAYETMKNDDVDILCSLYNIIVNISPSRQGIYSNAGPFITDESMEYLRNLKRPLKETIVRIYMADKEKRHPEEITKEEGDVFLGVAKEMKTKDDLYQLNISEKDIDLIFSEATNRLGWRNTHNDQWHEKRRKVRKWLRTIMPTRCVIDVNLENMAHNARNVRDIYPMFVSAVLKPVLMTLEKDYESDRVLEMCARKILSIPKSLEKVIAASKHIHNSIDQFTGSFVGFNGKEEEIFNAHLAGKYMEIREDKVRTEIGLSPGLSWVPLINKSYFDPETELYLVPLMNNSELVIEGRAMNHCVGSGGYNLRSTKGSCRIFSVRDKDMERVATVELSLMRIHDKEIRATQVQGKSNQKNEGTKLAEKAVNNMISLIKDGRLECNFEDIISEIEKNKFLKTMSDIQYDYTDQNNIMQVIRVWKEYLPKDVQEKPFEKITALYDGCKNEAMYM